MTDACGPCAGHLRLDEVELKPEALNFLQLPIALRRGVVGRIDCKWSRSALFGSQPIVLRFDRVFLLAEPKLEWDAEELERRVQQLKRSRLAALDLLKSKLQDTGSEGAGFADRLVTKIIDNIEIHLHDVHVRFEDRKSRPEHPFSFGVTLQSLHAQVRASRHCASRAAQPCPPQSTDQNWRRMLIESASMVHKLVELRQLSLYWNPGADLGPRELDPDTCPFRDIAAAFERLIPRRYADSVTHPGHRYVLRPLDAVLKLARNKDARDLTQPGTWVKLEVDDLSFLLDDAQVRTATAMSAPITAAARDWLPCSTATCCTCSAPSPTTTYGSSMPRVAPRSPFPMIQSYVHMHRARGTRALPPTCAAHARSAGLVAFCLRLPRVRHEGATE